MERGGALAAVPVVLFLLPLSASVDPELLLDGGAVIGRVGRRRMLVVCPVVMPPSDFSDQGHVPVLSLGCALHHLVALYF